MKTQFKFIICIISFITVFILAGCSLYYELDEKNGIDIGYSKRENNAFIADVLWKEGESLEITLPDEYKNIKIKELGGYFGRGVPSPFSLSIELEDDAYNGYEEIYYTKERYLENDNLGWWDEYEVIDYDFEITLPSYLKRVKYVSMDVLVLEKTINDKTVATIIRPTCYFKIAEDNQYFYTLEGKLYDKETDELIDVFVYRD